MLAFSIIDSFLLLWRNGFADRNAYNVHGDWALPHPDKSYGKTAGSLLTR
jgi:hypothetical protein